jgi:hypothetical protein
MLNLLRHKCTTFVSSLFIAVKTNVLVILDPCHCGFASGIKTLSSSFLPSSGVKVDPILKLISVYKISPIVGMILTWELRK